MKDGKFELGDRVITLDGCNADEAQVDAGVEGVVSREDAFGNLDVSFNHCIFNGQDIGKRAWVFGEHQISLIK